MKYKARYSIGEVSKICNISKKTLRYYDEIGLITTQRKDYNNYRYYTNDSLLAVPIIKYYKQMGFKLEEMREFIEGDLPNVYRAIQKSFLAKIEELAKAQREIERKHHSVRDWYNLILEAEQVIEHSIQDVSIKYIEGTEVLFMEQLFENNIKASVINIAFTNYLEELKNEITGPVIIQFTSFKDRMRDVPQKVKILQKPLLPCSPNLKIQFGGQMMASCYHIGPHATIRKTYEKICLWAKKHAYTLDKGAYERYVTDYWTTRNDSQFVTEVLIKATRESTLGT